MMAASCNPPCVLTGSARQMREQAPLIGLSHMLPVAT